MMLRVDVATELLIWALERSGREPDDLMGRFPRLQQWLLGDVQPTLKQLESFSKAVYVPLGYLFLLEPPKETTPIPDLRTMGSADLSRISPNLLDTIYLCQNRQAWYRDYARTSGEDTCDFVGSTTVNSPVESTAAMIRAKLGFDLEQRRSYSTWTDALREFISQAESAGVLVMV
ncbi:MAG TPA: DNA-binding protein, partial [Bacteroidetes bacterium]|nr:DNA-binding protein [Bacteroidota bacterium]HEX04157.1 DNA-binding protein [Bacteroidota bacterium]